MSYRAKSCKTWVPQSYKRECAQHAKIQNILFSFWKFSWIRILIKKKKKTFLLCEKVDQRRTTRQSLVAAKTMRSFPRRKTPREMFASETTNGEWPAHSSRAMYQFLFFSVFQRFHPCRREPRDTISFYLLDPLHDPRLLRSSLFLLPVLLPSIQDDRPRGDQRQIEHANRGWRGYLDKQRPTTSGFGANVLSLL